MAEQQSEAPINVESNAENPIHIDDEELNEGEIEQLDADKVQQRHVYFKQHEHSNSAVEAHVQLRINDDARLGVIEINVAHLKHIVNIIVFFCGLSLVVSVMALVK